LDRLLQPLSLHSFEKGVYPDNYRDGVVFQGDGRSFRKTRSRKRSASGFTNWEGSL